MIGRIAPWALAGALGLWLFSAVALPDLAPGFGPKTNFIFRDAGHFYYPLYQEIQDQWNDGRIPLWSPGENGGQPLLANPTSGVLYPGKLLFFLLPYAAAYRWFHMLHVALAFGATMACARGFGLGRWASTIAALAYAFSGFVLYQINNVVFLIGAAWLPLGLLAVDRVVRRPSRFSVIGLAAVLALQTLGGDPEAALLLGVAALPYGLIYHLGGRRGAIATIGFLGLGATIVHARSWISLVSGQGFASDQGLEPAAWIGPLVALLALPWVIRPVISNLAIRRTFGSLAIVASLALLFAAAQVLPTVAFARRTDRAAPEAPKDSAAFSFFPARIAELAVPAFFGHQLPQNTRWAPFRTMETGVWIPTIYLGLPTLLLAIAAMAGPRDPRIRFLAIVTIASFWMALGKFGGVYWLIDSAGREPKDMVRQTGSLYGETDGLYRIAEEAIPGFRSFRYPSKTLVFTSLAIALLAGFGLDRLSASARIPLKPLMFMLAIAGGSVVFAVLARPWIMAWMTQPSKLAGTIFGPLDPSMAWRDLLVSLSHTTVALAAMLAGAVALARGWLAPAWRGPAMAGLLAIDLAVAQGWLILVGPQESIDAPPKLASVIERAEKADASNGPFRIHRTRIFNPFRWFATSSPDRVLEVSRWERDTLQAKYGREVGLSYAWVQGTMSLYDTEFFFAPWTVTTPDSVKGTVRGAPEVMVYFPRNGFNLWGARYFVLPRGAKLDDEDRGNFTLLGNRLGAVPPVLAESPADEDDYLVLKNIEAFPRAWIVRQAEFIDPIVGLRRRDRLEPMEKLLYREFDAGLQVWQGIERREFPLRERALLEVTDPFAFTDYLKGGRVLPSESVRVASYEPERVELEVKLDSPGLVIVADTFAEGWTATINGSPAPILRANRAMRALAAPAGESRIVMSYRDRMFEIGAAISAVAWIAALATSSFSAMRRRPRST